jgi:hypothetical protein
MRKVRMVKKGERGAALAIALFVTVILLGFAALALSRAASETIISASDSAESRTFAAAEAALEDATRDFATRIENKLVLAESDIEALERSPVPHFSEDYDFVKKINQIGSSEVVTLTKGQFQGLVSLRDEWEILVTAREKATGVETVVRRRFFNDRVPIFQFGAFYQDDIEVNDPPTFVFNGRIHTNGNFFTNSNGNDIRYKSKITIAGELIRDRWKNGAALLSNEQSNNVYALNTANADKQIKWTEGSVTCSAGTGGILKDITKRNFPYPKCVKNPNWATTISKNFEGNVITNATELKLPVYSLNVPLIEMVRRGKNVGDTANFGGTIRKVQAGEEDNGVLSKERFANKEGLRVSLADSQERLPQCANIPSNQPCGVRLDAPLGSSRGYKPKQMRGSPTYKTTALNGNRFAISGREVWIKVELVRFNADTQKPETEDVTEDILSLGVTEPIIKSGSPSKLQVKGYDSNTDSRSVIKLQRFAIEGDPINESSGYDYIRSVDFGSGKKYNFVTRIKECKNDGTTNCKNDVNFATPIGSVTVNSDESYHYQLANFNGDINNSSATNNYKIVPFPIKFQDTREGNRANSETNLSANKVFKNGVMSMVDIDVANLRRFLNGEFDNYFPTDTPFAVKHGNRGLTAADVPQNRGWVLYVSDRRGDYNFDGRYNMEDVFPNEDDKIDEDIDNDGKILKASDSNGESPNPIDETVEAAYAAVTDHLYYRRGVRLINGERLPGKYDYDTPGNTKGFTLASENGVYVWKNYNVSYVSAASGSGSTTSDKYRPLGKTDTLAGIDSEFHIPAAIVGDAVTILSNNWDDAKGFAYPNTLSKRVATDTQVRFAMIAGDPITGRSENEGMYGKQNGGLINFKRYLESWTSKRLNYSGSLINLYNAYNNNARHKPNYATYNPPDRDWTFEESFKDPYRLPPGTPFVYFITFTGFERIND